MPRRAAIAITLLAVLLVSAHLLAESQARLARDPGRPLEARLSAAALASRIEPFNRRFAVTRTIVEAQTALRTGNVDTAYELLLPLSTTVRGDALFRQTYQDTLAEKTPLDARKAHQQHAKEREDGGLAPEDVFE